MLLELSWLFAFLVFNPPSVWLNASLNSINFTPTVFVFFSLFLISLIQFNCFAAHPFIYNTFLWWLTLWVMLPSKCLMKCLTQLIIITTHFTILFLHNLLSCLFRSSTRPLVWIDSYIFLLLLLLSCSFPLLKTTTSFLSFFPSFSLLTSSLQQIWRTRVLMWAFWFYFCF